MDKIKRKPTKLTSLERSQRDNLLIKMYQSGDRPSRLAAHFCLCESAVFAILARHKVTTLTQAVHGRGGSRFVDADANALVSDGFCMSVDVATKFLRRADYFQANPHKVVLSEMGVTKHKIATVNQILRAYKAHLTAGPPFYVYFASKHKFILFTFRELLSFMANPLVYLIANKDKIVSAPGVVNEQG